MFKYVRYIFVYFYSSKYYSFMKQSDNILSVALSFSIKCALQQIFLYSQMNQNKYDQSNIGLTGCYAAVGSDQPPIELPLRYFAYEIDIVDCYAQVTMVQHYYNPTNQVLDVQYIFPVHPNSTVNKLEIEFDGKKSQGVVMEREQAKNQYEHHLNEGAGVAYGEYNPQSRDIMKMMVGNIKPKQAVKVFLSYMHLNSLVCNTFYQFKLASTMTPRYARALDVASLIFNSSPGSKSVEGKCYWSIKINIKSSQRILKIESVTHNIKKIQEPNNISVTFADKNQLPNKDFTLYYTLENYDKPQYSLSQSDNNTTAAISFIPKFSQLSIDDAQKQMKKEKQIEVDLDVSKGEYVFLLDRSGSMDGIRIQNAKRALEIFLRSLPEDSYFNVLSFGSNYKYLFPQSARNTKAEIDKAVEQISKMGADMGGTQILAAIQSLAQAQVVPGYPKQLFFLTDGAVSNVNEVLRYISKHTQHTRVNSIGIGNGCSKQLIQGCAEKGKGYFIFIEDEEKPQGKIITMLANTLSPVISSMQFDCIDANKIESIVPNPKKMPYILKNDIVNFYITFNGKLTEPLPITIKYRDTLGTKYQQKLIINPKAQQVECKWLSHLINYKKIQALVDVYQFGQEQQDRIYYVKTLDKDHLRQQIIELSVKHQILTELTAFLCLDAYAVDQIKKSLINHPKQKISIQGMNPYDHVVEFVNEGDNNYDDGGYVDECCIMDYELPPDELKKIMKFEETIKVYRNLPMYARVAGAEPSIKAFSGIIKYQNPQKKLPYSFITKKQDSNGSWTEDFLDSLFPIAKELRQVFEKLTDRTSYLTFLVCQYLIRFHPNEAKNEFLMIIRKGKHYVQKNSKKGWKELENVYHKYYKPLKQ